MTKEEFLLWKENWFDVVPHCRNFSCVHDLMSCGIKILCGDCSIYETYARQKNPQECTTVSCIDCMKKNNCKEIRQKDLIKQKDLKRIR